MTWESFWFCFVPLFIAVDSFGLIPIFIGLMEGVERSKVKAIVFSSIITALVVALLFLFVGEIILRWLGISVEDFMVAGGIVLFLISTNDLLTVEKKLRVAEPENLGPVPLGVPLIVGPAVLTTMMILVREYGFTATATAVTLNILIVGLLFLSSSFILKFLGKSGTKILSKIASLLLAAIAVMMVRKGIFAYITMIE